MVSFIKSRSSKVGVAPPDKSEDSKRHAENTESTKEISESKGRSTHAWLVNLGREGSIAPWREEDDSKVSSKRPSRLTRLLCCLCLRRSNKKEKARWSPFRVFIHKTVRSTSFSNFILGVIFLNSVLITLQMVDSTNMAAAYYFDVFDKILMGIYILELSMKLYAYQERFLESGWNIFDAFIVSISIVETTVYTIANNESNFSPAIFRLFRVFKALRAMRAIRAISFLKNLQVIIVTLLKSIPAMGSIILLLMLILYIFAIIFVTLYQDILPHSFGNLWLAMFSLFQLITLDDWSEYYYTVLKIDASRAPQLMVYMSIFIVLETFICINLFIAVIVNNLERANMRERQRKKRKLEMEAKKNAAQIEDNTGVIFPKKKKKKRRKRKKDKESKSDNAKDNNKEGSKRDLVPQEDPLNPTTNRKRKKGGGGGSEGGSRSREDLLSPSLSSFAESEEEDLSSDEETGLNAKTPSEMFLYDSSIPLWQRELQPEVLALIASLDHNMNVLNSHQGMLDELVDVTVPGLQTEDGGQEGASQEPVLSSSM